MTKPFLFFPVPYLRSNRITPPSAHKPGAEKRLFRFVFLVGVTRLTRKQEREKDTKKTKRNNQHKSRPKSEPTVKREPAADTQDNTETRKSSHNQEALQIDLI